MSIEVNVIIPILLYFSDNTVYASSVPTFVLLRVLTPSYAEFHL